MSQDKYIASSSDELLTLKLEEESERQDAEYQEMTEYESFMEEYRADEYAQGIA